MKYILVFVQYVNIMYKYAIHTCTYTYFAWYTLSKVFHPFVFQLFFFIQQILLFFQWLRLIAWITQDCKDLFQNKQINSFSTFSPAQLKNHCQGKYAFHRNHISSVFFNIACWRLWKTCVSSYILILLCCL